MTESTTNTNLDILKRHKGTIQFRLTNAYLFVAVLQKNQEALYCLIAALLHMRRKDILDIKILNPIILGEAIDRKDCVMDILVLLNDNTKINLEIQVENEGNWDNRSIYYLARNISDLETGDDYNSIKKVYQIGILDFNYPSDNQELYQEYVLMNRKTHRIYSDKLHINVLCLSQLKYATPEEREGEIYQWAKVFKATTWEELKALSENNQVIQKTIVTMAELTEDEKIKQQCLRREKYERDMISATNYGKKLGYESGIESGRMEGEEKKLIQQICKKLQKGKSPSEIADALEDELDNVSHICSVAAAFAPEYDCDLIYQKLQENTNS